MKTQAFHFPVVEESTGPPLRFTVPSNVWPSFSSMPQDTTIEEEGKPSFH